MKKVLALLLMIFGIFVFTGCDFFRGADDPTTTTGDPTLTTTTNADITTTTTRNPDTTQKTSQEIDIIFRDWDGTLLDQATVPYSGYNATPIAPTPPPRPNYFFYSYSWTGLWDDQITSITYTKTVYATYFTNYVSISSYDASMNDLFIQNLTGLSQPTTRQEIFDYMVENFSANSEHELFDILLMATTIKNEIELSGNQDGLNALENYNQILYANENAETSVLVEKFLELLDYLYTNADLYINQDIIDDYNTQIQTLSNDISEANQALSDRATEVENFCLSTENHENGECDEWWDNHYGYVILSKDYFYITEGVDRTIFDFDSNANLFSAYDNYVNSKYITMVDIEENYEIYEGIYNSLSVAEQVIVDQLIPTYEVMQMYYYLIENESYTTLESEMINGKTVLQYLQEYLYGWTDEDEVTHPSCESLYETIINLVQTELILDRYLNIQLLFTYDYFEIISYYLDNTGI